MQPQHRPPAYVSTLALLNRQLTDWQNLLAQFEDQAAPADQVTYCRQQIERLKAELKTLSN